MWHRTFLDTDHAAGAVVVDTSAQDTVVGYLLLALDPLDHVCLLYTSDAADE